VATGTMPLRVSSSGESPGPNPSPAPVDSIRGGSLRMSARSRNHATYIRLLAELGPVRAHTLLAAAIGQDEAARIVGGK
jgi:hypothetical protein